MSVFAILVLSGCAPIGPNFREPPPPQTSRFTEKPLPRQTVRAASPGGHAQTFVTARDIPGEWWALFHSPSLNQLVVEGIENNSNLQAALAALRVAEQNLAAGRGQMFPAIGLAAGANRQRTSQAQFGAPSFPNTTFNLYNVAFNVSYTLDLFGGIRRQIEALGAQVDYQRYQWDAAYLTLTANIVTTAITEASLRGQIATTLMLIREQSQILRITQQQLRLGGVSGITVLTQATLLAQLRATLPPLQKRLAQNRNALAALVGRLPSEAILPKFYLNELTLPAQVPVTIPSQLVCQRPDIQAAEALLHAASAQIGVATANLLPQITLNASYGWTGISLANLFTKGNSVWLYGAQLAQPLFQGGLLIAKRRAAIATFDQAAGQYRQTVLNAFQNVADALNALEIDAITLQDLTQAERSGRANFILSSNQYKLGGVNYLNLLNAQLQYQQIRLSRIQAQAARYADTAALLQALGGGWWHVIPDTTRRQLDG